MTRSPATKAVAALFFLALFVFVQVLGSSPQLHRIYHPDADDSQHHCVVTLLASGQVLAPVIGDCIHSAVQEIVLQFRISENLFRSVFDLRLQPERAPPIFIA